MTPPETCDGCAGREQQATDEIQTQIPDDELDDEPDETRAPEDDRKMRRCRR
jgi:hypothetical protein